MQQPRVQETTSKRVLPTKEAESGVANRRLHTANASSNRSWAALSNKLQGSVSTESIDHYAYLRLLPSSIWKVLFENSVCLQAIIKSLDELERLIVIRLCFLHQPVSERAMQLWVNEDGVPALRRSINILISSNVLSPIGNASLNAPRTSLTQYSLDKCFQSNLRKLLLQGPSWDKLQCMQPAYDDETALSHGKRHKSSLPDREVLHEHSRGKWDNILRYIVSPYEGDEDKPLAVSQEEAEKTGGGLGLISQDPVFLNPIDDVPPVRPCEDVVTILKRKKLLPRTFSGSSTRSSGMSREAFSWFLKDLRSQIISLVVEFLFMLDAGDLSDAAHQVENTLKSYNSSSTSSHHAMKKDKATFMGSSALAGGSQSVHSSEKVVGFNHLMEKTSSGLPETQGNVGNQDASQAGIENANMKASSKSISSNLHSSYPLGMKENPQAAARASSGNSERVAAAAKAVQEVLIMILWLSQSTIGHPFSALSLSSVQRRFLLLAYDIGLIWMKHPSRLSQAAYTSHLESDHTTSSTSKSKNLHYYVAPYALLLKADSKVTRSLTSSMSTLSADFSRRRAMQAGGDASHDNFLAAHHYFGPLLKRSGVMHRSQHTDAGTRDQSKQHQSMQEKGMFAAADSHNQWERSDSLISSGLRMPSLSVHDQSNDSYTAQASLLGDTPPHAAATGQETAIHTTSNVVNTPLAASSSFSSNQKSGKNRDFRKQPGGSTVGYSTAEEQTPPSDVVPMNYTYNNSTSGEMEESDETRSKKKFQSHELVSSRATHANVHQEGSDAPTSHPSSQRGLEAGILVQSNFKVYVYTASALQISILSHLCELQARTINLVVGILTRESVLAAYRSGITADQILRFLESHAHPALHDMYVREGKSFIPENVVMQLKMWEAERQRLTLETAVVFKRWQQDFLPELFQKSVKWAIGKGYCLYYTKWDDDPDSLKFSEWMMNEKYLCILPDAKAEMINKIREFREIIRERGLQSQNQAGDDADNLSSVSSQAVSFL